MPYRLATAQYAVFQKSPTESCRGRPLFIWGGRWDSNPRSSEPQSDALTKLRYAHHGCGSAPAKSLSAHAPLLRDGVRPICGKGTFCILQGRPLEDTALSKVILEKSGPLKEGGPPGGPVRNGRRIRRTLRQSCRRPPPGRADESEKHPLVRQFFGAPTGIRTQDLLLRRQLLYPTELLAQIAWSGQWESNPPIQLGRLAY